MLKKIIMTAVAIFSINMVVPVVWAGGYGQTLCKLPEYNCVKIQAKQSWASMFPDTEIRMMVRKVNRMNTPLHAGMIIAVPKNVNSVKLMDLAPFPSKIDPPHNNLVQVNLSKLAWGAYDENGTLVNWGPVSGGKGYCPDIHRGCHTPTGNFTVYDRQGAGCISHVFPVATHGGAPMPYCMHFHGGFALHGSPTVPGFNASHGCVRLFVEDAEWLNHQFVNVGSTRVRIVP
jgi:hypothetical protein